jgi:preprotein translocase subunit YajC
MRKMNLEVLLLLIFMNVLITILFIVLLFLFLKEEKIQLINVNSQDLAFAFYFSLLFGLKGDTSLFLAFLSICSLILFIKTRRQKLSNKEEQKEDLANAHIF